MKDYASLASEYFFKGYNCAQAVACAFSEELGLDEAVVARMVSSFGGGVGRLREVCGAVSGAAFVLGALRGYSEPGDDEVKAAHYARVQKMAERFKAAHNTIICRELLENVPLKQENSHVPEKRTPEYYAARPCARFVETAAEIVGNMLAEEA